MDIQKLVRTIPNFPKPGIMFRDITTLLADAEGFKSTIDLLKEHYKTLEFDYIVGIESRGFILGAALAYALGKGFVPIRKKGKLPGKTVSLEYTLEYGSDTIEIHCDAFKPGSKVIVIDDLMATGGTAINSCKLVEKIGGQVVEVCVAIDLPEIQGSQKVKVAGYNFYTLMEFEGE